MHRRQAGVMAVQPHPFLAAQGRAVERGLPPRQTDHMGLRQPHRIGAAQDRREVVGLVHLLQQDGEITHAAIEHGLEPLEASGQ